MTLRPVRADEVGALHALIERAYRGETARAGWTHEADLLEGARTTADALRALLDDPGEAMLVAADGAGAIVGCVQLSRRPGGGAYLGLLAVEPARQAGGLGRRILAAAEAEARARYGARTIELTVVSQRVELIAYYERRGYARTGERRPFPVPLDPPFALVVLAKAIG